ncbi:unnamed protein product [Pedinophyceae sp. YPF-701]|nr:unnamed protein product [Pedinophyceae sp. YPF-701]
MSRHHEAGYLERLERSAAAHHRDARARVSSQPGAPTLSSAMASLSVAPNAASPPVSRGGGNPRGQGLLYDSRSPVPRDQRRPPSGLSHMHPGMYQSHEALGLKRLMSHPADRAVRSDAAKDTHSHRGANGATSDATGHADGLGVSGARLVMKRSIREKGEECTGMTVGEYMDLMERRSRAGTPNNDEHRPNSRNSSRAASRGLTSGGDVGLIGSRGGRRTRGGTAEMPAPKADLWGATTDNAAAAYGRQPTRERQAPVGHAAPVVPRPSSRVAADRVASASRGGAQGVMRPGTASNIEGRGRPASRGEWGEHEQGRHSVTPADFRDLPPELFSPKDTQGGGGRTPMSAYKSGRDVDIPSVAVPVGPAGGYSLTAGGHAKLVPPSGPAAARSGHHDDAAGLPAERHAEQLSGVQRGARRIVSAHLPSAEHRPPSRQKDPNRSLGLTPMDAGGAQGQGGGRGPHAQFRPRSAQPASGHGHPTGAPKSNPGRSLLLGRASRPGPSAQLAGERRRG